MEKVYDVFGLGNTLMDFLIKVDDGSLERIGLKKGIFQVLEEEKTHSLLDEFRDHKVVPAGAVTNTLMGIAALGGKCILCGSIGSGMFGDIYEERITREGVTPRLFKNKQVRTGKVLSFVTPDAERTFGVHLGAATTLKKESVIDKDIISSKIFYFTGFELESLNSAVMHSIGIAKKNNVKVAMDLADPELVKRNIDRIMEIIKSVDILFMNENEAKSFTGKEPQEAAKEAALHVKTVVVKIGEGGSIIAAGGKIYRILPDNVEALDTTGAGDLYAAGFLYGIVKDKNIEDSGRLGSFMGAKAVSQMGALLSEKAKEEIVQFYQK